MDFKTLKQDLTYCCKKFAKEGKTLSAYGDNLSIIDGKFVSDSSELDPLEMLVLVKGYVPTQEQKTIYHEKWQDPQGKWHESWTPHSSAYSLSMLDVLVEQASLVRSDLYAFLNGFENVLGCGDEKSEYYTLGVYIREKFAPIGARTEPLKSLTNYVYRIQDGKTPERMFVVYTRKNETSIVEAECYVLSAMNDPSVVSLPQGEFRALVTAPELLFEKKVDKSIGPAIYHSHSLFRDYNDALKEAQSLIEKEFAFKLRKYKTPYTDVDVAAAVLAIKLIKLPGSTFMTDAEKLKTLSPSEFTRMAKEAGHDNWGVDDPELAPVW